MSDDKPDKKPKTTAEVFGQEWDRLCTAYSDSLNEARVDAIEEGAYVHQLLDRYPAMDYNVAAMLARLNVKEFKLRRQIDKLGRELNDLRKECLDKIEHLNQMYAEVLSEVISPRQRAKKVQRKRK